MKNYLKIFIFFLIVNSALFSQKMNILVFPFTNTGSKDFSWISAGMTATVISDLNNIQSVTVISQRDRIKALKEIELKQTGLLDEDTSIQTGKILGANVIFTGNYLVMNQRIRVNAKLIWVETGDVKKSIKIDGTLDHIFELQDKIVIALMKETSKIKRSDFNSIKLEKSDIKKIKNKTKPKLSSFMWYSKGLEVEEVNPRLALGYFEKSIHINNNYIPALLKAAWISGGVFNQYKKGFQYLKKVEALFQRRKEVNTNNYSELMKEIGDLYYSQKRFNMALKYYFKSKKIKSKLRLQNAGLITNIGIIYSNKKEFQKALWYYNQAKTIYTQLGRKETSGYAALLQNIGVLYKRKQDYSKALFYSIKSKKLRDRLHLQNSNGYADVIYNIALLYKEKRQFRRSLRYFIVAKKIYRKIGIDNTSKYGFILVNIGFTYKHLHQMKNARKYFKEGYYFFKKLGKNKLAKIALDQANQ